MTVVEQPLNLAALARSGAGVAQLVPGTPFEVWALTEGQRLELAAVRSGPTWLLVLEGDLIIDLPYGDFRHLRPGDALHLEAELPAQFQALEDTVLLLRAD